MPENRNFRLPPARALIDDPGIDGRWRSRYNSRHMGQTIRWKTLLLGAATAGFCLCSASPVTAGDAFFKGGVIFQPRDVGIAGRWRLSFGSDYAMNLTETVFLGFELQTSVYRQDVLQGGPTATVIPGNGLVNVKWKSASLGARPFLGGGFGMLSTFVLASGNNHWDNSFGFQIVGGVEAGHLVVELQMQRGFESGSDTSFAAFLGFTW